MQDKLHHLKKENENLHREVHEALLFKRFEKMFYDLEGDHKRIDQEHHMEKDRFKKQLAELFIV